MNFFLQILCGLGLRGPSSACWLSVRSNTRLDMVLLKLFRRSAGISIAAGANGAVGVGDGSRGAAFLFCVSTWMKPKTSCYLLLACMVVCMHML
jgi:hypothetical protein